MDKLSKIPPVLSIKQPWVDLILRGEKTIEVREKWRIDHRGAILIHASRTIDWKTVELLDYCDVMKLPRGGFVGVTEILDVIEFTRETWLDLMPRHRVVHPPVREPIYGAILGEIVRFRHLIRCSGTTLLFPVPPLVEERTRRELVNVGLMDPL